MAKGKIPIAQYKKVARDLGKVAPKLKSLAKKKKLTAADKRSITRVQNQVKKLHAGAQRIIPLTEKQVSQLHDKTFLVPGLNAVVDRNIAKDTRAIVKRGELYIRENGRYLKLIKIDATKPENVIEAAEKLFKGKRKRFNVWVRFNNGRSNSAFTDVKALLDFIIMIYEKYEPVWASDGYDIDDIVEGFEIYEQPPGIFVRKGKKPIKPKKKPSHHRKRKAPKRKKNTLLKRALKARFGAPKKPVKKTVKKPVKKTVKPPRKPSTRGKKKANRRR